MDDTFSEQEQKEWDDARVLVNRILAGDIEPRLEKNEGLMTKEVFDIISEFGKLFMYTWYEKSFHLIIQKPTYRSFDEEGLVSYCQSLVPSFTITSLTKHCDSNTFSVHFADDEFANMLKINPLV